MYILFDIGGTNMRVASSLDGESFEKVVKQKTPTSNFDDGVKLLESMIKDVADNKKITAIAGGIAGPLDQKKTKLVNSPHISGWIEKPLKKVIENIFNAPVFLENDSALVGLGEAVYGAGKGKEIVVYITISTGVGGVRIVNGKVDANAMGFEPGHQIIHGKELEKLISGTALEKRFHRKPYEVKDPKVWDEVARVLAHGLNNTIVHWSPDIVVLGGSMMKDIPVDKTAFYLKKMLHIFPKQPIIKKAKLKDKTGIYGALALLTNRNAHS